MIPISLCLQNPVLRTLYWLLVVMDCLMLDCPVAKESFVDNNMTTSLNRLWPWCMMTEQLRQAVMHLIYTFNNDCPKGKIDFFIYFWIVNSTAKL